MTKIRVTSKQGADFTEFVVECANNPILKNFDISIIEERDSINITEIKDLIIEKGQTDILSQGPLLEQLVTKGEFPNVIVKILHTYLDKMTIDKELIIVDPYFFPSNYQSNYCQFIMDVLDPSIDSIEELKIVTGSHVNNSIKSNIISSLQSRNSKLNISHAHSNDFHDRYWISNGRESGLIIGTSMNGLGNKYALIDRLNKIDVRLIVSELTSNGLI